MPAERHLRPLDWCAHTLWQQLSPLLPGLVIEVAPRLASTNTTLLERARAEAVAMRVQESHADRIDSALDGESGTHGRRRLTDVAPCLLVAQTQTAGRGRQGKAWLAAPGASLTFSLSMPLAPADWSGLSLAVGLALADALEPMPPVETPRLQLKWPNDLLWCPQGSLTGAGKLGGILIETVAVGTSRVAVIGIGLNIQPLTVSEPLPWGHACLQSLHPGVTAPEALAIVARPVVQAVQAFERQGFAPCVGGFARRDALRGRTVNTSSPQASVGIADGVDHQGLLWLRCGAQRVPVASGEVTLGISAGASGC